MTSVNAIVVENLTVIYNENTSTEVIVFKDFNLIVKRGEILVVTGGNGTGKSTLLKAILGIIPIKSGKIMIDGKDVTSWSAIRRAKLIGSVYQDTMLGTCPNLSVNENFQLTNSKQWWSPLPYSLKLKKSQTSSIQKTGLQLDSRGSTKINMLSGGQRQAIAVCLVLENNKQILLLDEFTSALDEKTAQNVIDYTFLRAKENKCTILMVMHDYSKIDELIEKKIIRLDTNKKQ